VGILQHQTLPKSAALLGLAWLSCSIAVHHRPSCDVSCRQIPGDLAAADSGCSASPGAIAEPWISMDFLGSDGSIIRMQKPSQFNRFQPTKWDSTSKH